MMVGLRLGFETRQDLVVSLDLGLGRVFIEGKI